MSREYFPPKNWEFFIVPGGPNGWQALPEPPEPTIFTIEDAMRALRSDHTLGMRAEDWNAGRTLVLWFKSKAGVSLQPTALPVYGLRYGEDITVGGRTPEDADLRYGYVTLTLTQPVRGTCLFCGKKPHPHQERRFITGLGGIAKCADCVERFYQILNEPHQRAAPVPPPIEPLPRPDR
jgi:hypothetical protein